MSNPRSAFLATLGRRGFIHQATDMDGLDQAILEAERAGRPLPLYIGFDATAPSLHVGSLIQIMCLRWAQRTGLKPIVVMGGGTTRLGDPSMRDESRQLLDDAAIAANMAGIRQVFAKYLTFGDGPGDAIMVDNAEWLEGLAYIPFLREVGRHFSVNRMLSFDSVRLRLEREQALTFLEFNYMILQAYDFMELFSRYGCRLQMGGSDQWGNIVNGIELTRRMRQAELYGLTTPLLTTASGAKMGKTASGAVWLNAEMLGAYDFWQYWRNVEDDDVGRFLRLYTELPEDEIARLERLGGAEINESKKVLANLVTSLAHGEQTALAAAETARQTFEHGAAAAGLPSATIPRATLEAGLGVVEALTLDALGLATSRGEARRLIAGGGARVNDQPVTGDGQMLTLADLRDGAIKLSAGKKKHALLRLDD